MPTIDQVVALLQSLPVGNYDRLTHQLEAIVVHEKSCNRETSARRLENELRKLRSMRGQMVLLPQDLKKYFHAFSAEVTEAELSLSLPIQKALESITQDHKHLEALRQHGIAPKNRLLFHGPSGTGKTSLAKILADRLELPQLNVNLHQLIGSHLGETSKTLFSIFETIRTQPAVYVFDEFDNIGTARNFKGDSGAESEVRRSVNTLLQNMDLGIGQSVVVATTNAFKYLDPAIVRRFDLCVEFRHPDEVQILELVVARIEKFEGQLTPERTQEIVQAVRNAKPQVSHAEIQKACLEAIREAIVHQKARVELFSLEQKLWEAGDKTAKTGK